MKNNDLEKIKELYKKGKYRKCIFLCEKELKLDHENFDILGYQVLALSKNDIDPKKTIELCNKLIHMRIEVDFYYFRGNAYYKIGKYTISLPNDAHHLIDIGRKLNICIGNSHYANKIKKQKCNVLLLKTDNNIVGCVELIEDKVIQSKGTNNLNIEFDLPLDVKKTILSYKQD